MFALSDSPKKFLDPFGAMLASIPHETNCSCSSCNRDLELYDKLFADLEDNIESLRSVIRESCWHKDVKEAFQKQIDDSLQELVRREDPGEDF